MLIMNKYTVIYGFDENQQFDIDNQYVILIEPRKKFIDNLKKKNVKLESRILMGTNISRQVILYDSGNNNYSVLKRPNVIVSREDVYTTSLINIIKKYNIKEIEQIIINIKIDNINQILDNVIVYNKMIKNIVCFENVDSDLLNYYNIIQQGIYQHKNINKDDPNICLFPCNKILFEEGDINDNYKNFYNFVKMNDINILTNNGKMLNDTCSITNIKKSNEIEIYENLVNNLHLIFLNDCITINNKNFDIIIQFNPLYLITHDTFEIIYPIENDILYVYKQHDIIYGNKDTMYNLYNVLKSNEFKEYIEREKMSRGKLYKFFSKNYFYDYITKIFNVIIKS